MKCRKACKLIPSYAELPSHQKKSLDEHLSSCPHCSLVFSSYLKSISLCKETVCFEESKDFWSDYQVNLSRPVVPTPLWSRIWTMVERVAGLFRTPVLGPVPAYIFSVFLIALLTLGLYPRLFSTQTVGSFKNDMVAQELEVRGAPDDGQYSHYIVAVAEESK
jgi:hypothetical protein